MSTTAASHTGSSAAHSTMNGAQPTVDIDKLLRILTAMHEKGATMDDPQYSALVKVFSQAYARISNGELLRAPYKDVSHGIAPPPPPGSEPTSDPMPGVQTVQNQPQQQRAVGKPMSYQWLVSQRDASLKMRLENRIAELSEQLEQMNASAAAGNPIDEAAKRKLLIELKSLQLSGLQKTLRTNIATDMHRMASTNAASRNGAASSATFRRIRKFSVVPDLIPMPERADRNRQVDLTSGRKKRHRDFIMSVLSHAHKFREHHQNQQIARTKINKAMIKWHLNKEKREMAMRERAEKERLHALKRDNEEEYIKMLQETKNERLLALLAQTDDYLRQIAEMVDQEQEAQEEKALEEQIRGSGVDTAKIEALQQALNQRREAAAKAAERRMEVSADATSQANREMRATYYQKIHKVIEDIKVQPSILVGGKLKEYQMDGLTWLISLFNNKLNGILADEMGLGKTIQTIALLAYLKEAKKLEGPFLVVAPLSTISNWANEFQKWCPALKTSVYKGSPQARKSLFTKMSQSGFNVCLTTFDFILKDKAQLGRFKWKYIIVDEGHRMKNHNSKLTQALQKHYQSASRLVLTGTPLQNSLPELWSLLNFLLPNIFNSSDSFETWFNQPFAQAGEKVEMNEEESLLVIKRLHKVLRPFLLRRLKTQVEAQLPDKTEKVLKCDMSAMQKAMYKSLSETGALQIASADGKSVNAKSMMNIMVQLRKICNHPYLFNQTIEYDYDDNLWRVAGKFELLDRILPKLKASGHRVLMFSQMTNTMNLMEDYFKMKDYTYMRLDGGVKADDRGQLLADFNAPNSPYFIFILSTRAGGLGLNLQTADTVILFDSDWNPQADLQAQDRAHRIGQKNAVLVLRLITINSVEERVLERANYKLDMDQKIIEAGMFHKNASAEDRRQFLLSLLKGSQEDEGLEEVPGDKEINDMISRSPEEYKLFQQMDKHRADMDRQKAETLGLPEPIPRLMTESELPAWLLVDINKQRQEKQEKATVEYGRGRRKRGPTTYADISDEQFEQLLQEGDEEAAAQEQARAEEKLRRRQAREAARAAGDDVMDVDGDSDSEDEPGGGMKRKRDSGDSEALMATLMPVYQRIITAVDPADPNKRLCDLFTESSLEAVGDYYEVVGEAMTMTEIENKLKNAEYKSPAHLYEDFKRLCSDAKSYSDTAESNWSRVADALEHIIEQEFKSAGLDAVLPTRKVRKLGQAIEQPTRPLVAASAFGEEPSPFPSSVPAAQTPFNASGPRVAVAAFGGSPVDDNPFPSSPSPFPNSPTPSMQSTAQQTFAQSTGYEQQQPQQTQPQEQQKIKISIAIPKK